MKNSIESLGAKKQPWNREFCVLIFSKAPEREPKDRRKDSIEANFLPDFIRKSPIL